ncbi:hypothetical protein LQW54_007987 [Pestalotiopsis sp. IQ-011]
MPSRSSSADGKKKSSKMTLEVDHYQILGVQRDAKCEDIQKAFFRQLQFPKKETKPQTPAMIEARDLLRERAYDILTNEKNREVYDQDLRRSFIYVFLEANGFEVKTTTTRREIVEFLETHDFIGYMRLQGLPIDGAELSLDGVNCFVLRDGQETWRKSSHASQTEVKDAAPVVDEIPLEASPKQPAVPLPLFSLPEDRLPAFKLPTIKVPKITIPTIKFPTIQLPSYLQSAKLPELWNVLRLVLLFLLLAWVFLEVPRASEETRNTSTLLALNDTQASHYDILGVPANATVEGIRRAPRAAALEQLHVDDKVYESGDDDINEVMIKIGEAYATLSSSARCLYDLEAVSAEERKYASCLEGYESILAAGALMKQHVEREKELELNQTQTEIAEAVLNETWAENWTERARTLTEQVSLMVPRHLVTSSFYRFLKFGKRVLTAIKDAALAAGTAVSEHVAAAKTSIPEYLRAAKDSVSKHLREAGGKVHKICYRHESLRLVVFFIGQLIGIDMCNTL